MAYVAPYVDATGLHLPTFQEILDDMITGMKTIFGNDIYLGSDSADYQLMSIFARKVYDANQNLQLAYNNRSPVTSIGIGLDSILKLNGLKRMIPSYSSCQVTLTGTAGTVVLNGIVEDINGYTWSLPASVTIGLGGTVDEAAICDTVGAITALPGELTRINTPTRGWTSVTNVAIATAGTPVELDSQVRARQSVSTAYPSRTELAGTYAGLAAVDGVARFIILENYEHTAAEDPNDLDLPGHSITCVVEGGTDADVAQAIYANRGIGANTNPACTTGVWITDPVYGAMVYIRFYRPTYVPIFVTISLTRMAGYTTVTADAIRASLVVYLNSLNIYETITISGLEGAALSVMPNLSRPLFSVTSVVAGTVIGAQAATDISIAHYAVAEGLLANIVLVES
jgi:uncharacterized phage protein gp47/JayE